MTHKKWIKYFVYILLILIVVFLGQYVFEHIRKNTEATYNIDPFFPNVVAVVVYGIIGFLLGIDSFLKEIKKVGTWKIDLPKIVLMGMPSLYFSFPLFIYYSNDPFIKALAYPIGVLLRSSTNFFSVFQLILGYSIITSFYKSNET